MKNEKLKNFGEIISIKNLLPAWEEFIKGKRSRRDTQDFSLNLMDNIIALHNNLINRAYKHGGYEAFKICDPKPRDIHKACVRDRVLHHAVFRILYSIFDEGFIFDSYSCRFKKGTNMAVFRLERFLRKLSKNNTRNIFALKFDIRRFFDSIDQNILLEIIKRKIKDDDTIWLIERIIKSFNNGIPLGNVTSQLFANIYLNELDQFIKHKLKIKYYLRYCDDFVILGENKEDLTKLIPLVNNFLKDKLKLTLHSGKIIIRKYHQGVDFLGYVVLPYYRVLRTKTKRRILKKIRKRRQDLQNNLISKESFNQSLQSYLGILKHCKGNKIKKEILNLIF